MLCSSFAIPHSSLFSVFHLIFTSFQKLYFLFIWPTKLFWTQCLAFMFWFANPQKRWHLIYRIALPQLISSVLLIQRAPTHPPLHIIQIQSTSATGFCQGGWQSIFFKGMESTSVSKKLLFALYQCVVLEPKHHPSKAGCLRGSLPSFSYLPVFH